MEPVIVFPDGQLAVRDLLRSLLAGRSESYARGAVVSTRAIPGADESRRLPYVQVRSDGKFRDSRLDGRATIRVLAYGAYNGNPDEGASESLASLCEGLLLAASSGDVRGSSPVTGPLITQDPDNGLPLAFFTITARLRPLQLESKGA